MPLLGDPPKPANPVVPYGRTHDRSGQQRSSHDGTPWSRGVSDGYQHLPTRNRPVFMRPSVSEIPPYIVEGEPGLGALRARRANLDHGSIKSASARSRSSALRSRILEIGRAHV